MVNTCVRHNGGSIVDLSFASPSVARQTTDWRVVEGVETLSDHLYIRFSVSTQSSFRRTGRLTSEGQGPRWSLKKFNRELLEEAAIVLTWEPPTTEEPIDIDGEAVQFRQDLTLLCDAAMPRIRNSRPRRRQVYWWSLDIANLRRLCVTARRQYARFRRRRHRPDDAEAQETELYGRYISAKKTLQLAIKAAKENAHKELLAELDRDPWGRPYRLVRGKLRPWAPPLTQVLRPQLLHEVVAALFPGSDPNFAPPPVASQSFDAQESGEDAPEVTEHELQAATDRLRVRNTAPGPDGVPGRALVLALKSMRPRLLRLLSVCMERGLFPKIWKSGKLVLLRKEGRPTESPSAYRPIVLLDEVGKIFEKIIADRLVHHLTHMGPDLAESQYGFRRRRSTIDAIARLRSLTREAIASGEVVVAVSLDIANAFNSIPPSCILEALVHHRVPTYLRRLLAAYLSDRVVVFPSQEGMGSHQVLRGVPQGSVLGPVLWNIGYNWVLRGEFLRGVSCICYADDTLVTAQAQNFRSASILATAGVAQVVARIRRLGLEVALHKSEAICFYGRRNAPPANSHIIVGGVHIGIRPTLKYLGLVLDSRWNFGPHLRQLTPKLVRTAGALSQLLPNVGGPNAASRKLYTGIVRSMALYGAPIWGGNLAARNAALLHKPQRAMAVRVIRGYRTISCEAATLLARTLPWRYEAQVLAQLHAWRTQATQDSVLSLSEKGKELRAAAHAVWLDQLGDPTAGHNTIAAIRPVFWDWLERRHGDITFRLTQVLTGHGCFGTYLCRIGREQSKACHHCTEPEDSAAHTLQACPAWEEERRELVSEVGVQELSLPAVIAAMVRSESAWRAMVAFCDLVMAAKEAAEREREASSLLPSRRRRIGRRNRAQNDLRPP